MLATWVLTGQPETELVSLLLVTEVYTLPGYVDIFRRMPGRMPQMFLQRREIAVESTTEGNSSTGRTDSHSVPARGIGMILRSSRRRAASFQFQQTQNFHSVPVLEGLTFLFQHNKY
jgi:hypothetical protein